MSDQQSPTPFSEEILQHMLEGCQIIGPDWRYLFLNDTALRHAKKTREELLGHSMLDLYPGIEGTEMFQVLAACMTSRQPGRILNQFKFPDESRGWFELRFVPVPEGVLILSLDVTDDKLSEQHLRTSEARSRSYIEHAPYAVLVMDEEGRPLDFNTAALELLGYSADALKRKSFPELMPEDDRPQAHQGLARLAKDGHMEGECRLQRSNGRLVWIAFHASRVWVDRFIVFCRIIEDWKHVETELRLRNAALEHSLNAFYIIDEEGRFVFVNQAYLDLWGYDSIDEVLGTAPEEHCTDPDLPRQIIAAHQASGEDSREFSARRRDGGTFDVLMLSRRFVTPEGRVLFMGSALDISERKLGEARIEHLNRVLRAQLAISQLISREKNPRNLMDETCRLLVEHRGYRGAMIVLADPGGGAEYLTEAGSCEGFQPFKGHLSAGETPPCVDKVKAGTSVWTGKAEETCSYCPIGFGPAEKDAVCSLLQHDNRVYGYLAVALHPGQTMDQEEAELFGTLANDVAFALHHASQQHLMQNLREERERFEGMLRQAQKMEAMGRLAGGIAHDFNNMLSVILGRTDIALTRLDREDPLAANLREIQKASLHSVELTRQLLTFSRKQPSSPQLLDLNEAIVEQLKILKRLLGENIALEFRPGGGTCHVRTDPSHVAQILTNLSINGRDAIQGEGSISIATDHLVVPEDGSALASLVSPGRYVLLMVSDTGCGMDAETRERIFEPFFTTKKPGRGTGLGLATVYGIVKQNGGEVLVESEPGAGTTFRIFLPCFEGKPEKTAETRGESSEQGTETILVVEDNPQVLDLASNILEECGYTVLVAPTPEEGCRIAGEHDRSIQLLLSDVIMPGMNGRELMDRIQQLQPGIKTVFMSGYTNDIISTQGMLEEQINFIHKPFSMHSLLETIRGVLDGEARN